VARLYWDGKLQRSFYDLNRQWGKHEITVSGTYKAKAGDIIEIRSGGSWKNDYRAWHLVTEEGELVIVADIDSSKDKARVTEYLQGKIKAEELINE
jgi:ABC-type histidine transport system ATPase subunit